MVQGKLLQRNVAGERVIGMTTLTTNISVHLLNNRSQKWMSKLIKEHVK
jgi:hypothetical protein